MTITQKADVKCALTCVFWLLVVPLSMFLFSGCVNVDHNLDVRGEVYGVQFTPTTGTIIGGYGNINYHQANVIAGQGSLIMYDQYGMTGTNLLSRQIFAVLPATDATVTMQQSTDWLLCILGYGVRNPFGREQTTVTVTPKVEAVKTP